MDREVWFRFDNDDKTLVPLRKPMKVKFKRLPHGEDLPVPYRATAGAAGLDVASADDVVIDSGDWAMVRTGFAIELPFGYEAQVRPRSGNAARRGITVLNSPGTIDSDWRGELQVILINHSPSEPVVISRGDRIAQLVIAPVIPVEVECVETLSSTVRGAAGFGSTGR